MIDHTATCCWVEGTRILHEADRVILLGPDGAALALDEVATTIVDGFAVPNDLAGVTEALTARYDVPAGDGASAAADLVAQLSQRGVLERVGNPEGDVRLRRRYLDLLARALVNLIYPQHHLWLEIVETAGDTDQRRLRDIRYEEPERYAGVIAAKREGSMAVRRIARDSHTMVGLRRLQNLERCAARIFADRVPGDFLEAGVCQGGASIFMRGLQVAYGESSRSMWVADSFAGLPGPSHPADVDSGLDFSDVPWLTFSSRAVRDHFRTYELLDDNVKFLEGWFADTLASAPVQELALLRLDGDLYESTWTTLEALYDRVASGGFVVVDDYFALEVCRRAVDDFLLARGIEADLRQIDWAGVCWRK